MQLTGGRDVAVMLETRVDINLGPDLEVLAPATHHGAQAIRGQSNTDPDR